MTELSDLIKQEKLAVHFQPIVSLKRKAVLGLEALARPQALATGLQSLTVSQLFLCAQSEGRLLDLDRLCRRKALQGYQGLDLPPDPKPLLFVNFEASLIDEGVVGSGSILNAVQAAGLSPRDVVIEINESRVLDTASLRRFVDAHRHHGFLIALDDLGAGHSNLPRIAELRPHIVKLDRGLVSGIDRDFFKQETFKSLVSLGRRVGCMILAEGVETAQEVDTCAALGAELFQGYHFCKPLPPEALDFETLRPAVLAAARRQREAAVQVIHHRRLEANRLRRITEATRNLLAAADPTGFETVLNRAVRSDATIECAYLLDRDGLQVTATIAGPAAPAPGNRLFAPAPRGTDHSNKEYFFSLLDAGLERYTTETYLSLATGTLCRTVASLVTRLDGLKYVLCMDLRVEI